MPLSHSAIQRMARKPLELLSRDVVTALSAGLNINEDIVLSAALDTMGMHSPVPPMPTVREALLQDSVLSLPPKNALLASYEAFASLPAPMPAGTVLSPQAAA
ncbi:hypothetical protein [Arthrobacter sp. HMSC08H08]|uniref:hypothetical protein n=1 Tax=Arthrobacter sp. HMSC08H08 TaxID=1581143 RepID=UPI00114CECD9|nr:hypothetical protein [Arthrobacter sp. HMSC08H08]